MRWCFNHNAPEVTKAGVAGRGFCTLGNLDPASCDIADAVAVRADTMLYRRVDECTECAYAGDDGDVMCYHGLPHDWFVQVNPTEDSE